MTGLQAANLVCQRLGQGRPADILPGGCHRRHSGAQRPLLCTRPFAACSEACCDKEHCPVPIPQLSPPA